MLSNSEFIIMLNQAASDRIELAKLLNISNEQLSYITNVEAGHGLLKIGSSLVPFENSFPKDTELYRLMSTRPDEKVFGEDPFSDRGSSDTLDGQRFPPGSNTDADTDEKAEFMRKIQEVAEKSEDFGELVRKYMGQNE